MKWIPEWLLRLSLTGPAAAMGLLMYVLGLTLLPATLAVLVGAALVVVMGVLASGRAESWVIQVKERSRPASPRDLEVWRHVASSSSRDLGARRLFVRRTLVRAGPAIVLVGRDSVVVSPAVLEGLVLGRLSVHDIGADVVRCGAEHRMTAGRRELCVWVVTLPSRALVGTLMRVLGCVLQRLLCRAAWQLRVVFGAICVADGVAHDRVWGGLAAGILVLVSYAPSAARREVERRARAQSVDAVTAAGHRCASHGPLQSRRTPHTAVGQAHVLTTATTDAPVDGAGERPRLYLVPD